MSAGKAPLPAWKKAVANGNIKNILILKGDHLGDLILCAPAVFAVRNAFPDSKITLAADSKGMELYKTLNLIDEGLLYKSPSIIMRNLLILIREIRDIRKIKYDLVINFRHDFRDILFSCALKKGFLATYNHKKLAIRADFRYTPSEPDEYEGENHLKLIDSLGIKRVKYQPKVDQSAAEWVNDNIGNDSFGVIHGVAGAGAKLWPREYFNKVAMAFSDFNLRPICVGEKEDIDLCQDIINHCPDGINLAGKLNFHNLFTLLSKAKIFVGLDSFIMHCAHMFNVPGVAIFSGTNVVSKWAPPSIKTIHHDVECAPCGLKTCNVADHPCMSAITADDVISKIEKLMERK